MACRRPGTSSTPPARGVSAAPPAPTRSHNGSRRIGLTWISPFSLSPVPALFAPPVPPLTNSLNWCAASRELSKVPFSMKPLHNVFCRAGTCHAAEGGAHSGVERGKQRQRKLRDVAAQDASAHKLGRPLPWHSRPAMRHRTAPALAASAACLGEGDLDVHRDAAAVPGGHHVPARLHAAGRVAGPQCEPCVSAQPSSLAQPSACYWLRTQPPHPTCWAARQVGCSRALGPPGCTQDMQRSPAGTAHLKWSAYGMSLITCRVSSTRWGPANTCPTARSVPGRHGAWWVRA